MQLAPFLCRPRAGRLRRAGLAAALLGGITIAGCLAGAEGLAPPLDAFYFPTGLAVSAGRGALYVANSDFDLQYNGGTVQVVDLAALRDKAFALENALAPLEGEGEPQGAREACGGVGLSVNDNPLLNPGPCTALPAAGYVKSAVTIGAFASGAVLVYRPDAPGARLFVPVRGDPSITFFDVSDDREGIGDAGTCGGGPFCLECNAGADTRCSDAFRIGDDPYENPRGLRLPLEPVGIAADARGEAIVTAHQTQNAASLVINRWDIKPTLEHYIGQLGSGPTDVASLPVPAIVTARAGTDSPIAYQPGFLITYRASSELDLLRYQDDEQAAPERPFLTRAAAIGINVNSSGVDSRGIAVDPGDRLACEAGCGACEAPPCSEAVLSCLTECASIPIKMYVANRAPASLLIGEVRTEIVRLDDQQTAAFETMEFHDTVPLSYGASRVALGHAIGEDGAPHLRVFAVAFDSRLIFSYDPEARRIDAVIRTGRGPHAIAFDTGKRTLEDGTQTDYSFMYVGHFTDSYIGVVDLDMRRPGTFGSMFISLGQPTPPRESN
ncbi:MAG: hypothetical protein IT372_39525 [Polyangiaceae bacterium]|nr:hypothetical protein [Polyangiaceae bacterium]